MANCWIGPTVIEKGAEGRRWLASQKDESTNPTADRKSGKVRFSKSNGALIVHMRGTLYFLQILEIDSKRASTIWVGDGQTKIGAVFTGASVKESGQSFHVQDFEIVINPREKPESRVTLRIRDFDLDNAGPAKLPSATYVEHIPGVQKLLKNLPRKQDQPPSVYGSESMSSPGQSQTGDLTSPLSAEENFGTQEGFSTQLPRIRTAQSKTSATGHQLDTHRRMRDELQTVVEPHAREEEEQPKKPNYLMKLLTSTRPKRVAATKNTPAQISTTVLETKSEAVKHTDEGDAVELLQHTVPEELASDSLHGPIFTPVVEPPLRSSTHPILDSKHEIQRSGAFSTNGGSDDAEVLGDSEKENGQQSFDVTNSSTRLKIGALQASVGNEQGTGESYLEDNPYKGMKKIPRSWIKIPEDQQEILDSAEAWVTPSLPESVLQERRTVRRLSEHAEEVAEQRIKRTNRSLASENDSDESESEPHEGEENGLTTEKQAVHHDFETTHGGQVRTEAENDYEKDTELLDPSLENEEPQRSYTLESTQEVGQPSEEQLTPSSRLHTSPESDDDVVSVVVSWSPSPERDQEVDQEPDNSDLDETISVIPESSIPEASFAMYKSVVSSEKRDSPKFIQVAASNPAEEDEEDEEEIEMAEPFALGNPVPPAEHHPPQDMETLPSQQLISTDFQQQSVVEVERTPRFKMLRSKIEPQTARSPGQINNTDCEVSSNFVVPGTAEEEYPLTEINNTFAVISSENCTDIEATLQSSNPGKQIETSSSELQKSMSGPSDIAPAFQALQSDCRSPSTGHYETQLQREFSTSSKTSKAVNAGEVDAIHKNSASTSLSKPSVMSEAPNSSPQSVTSSIRSVSASVKRTSHAAELDNFSPPAKRKSSGPYHLVKFTPGTQSPVDLEKLKKLNRDDFLRGNEESAAFPNHFSEHQHYAKPKVMVGTKTNADLKNTVTGARSHGEQKKNSNPFTANDQELQDCSASEERANIYERYRQAYPSFAESVHAFIRACVYIEWLTPQHLMPTLWDDFVHKFCYEYPKYVVKCSNPLSAVKWYNDHDDFTYQKKVLGRQNLKEVLALDPIETEKARDRFRGGVPKELRPQTREPIQVGSTPTTEERNQSSRSVPTPVGSSKSDASDNVEVVGVRSEAMTRKRVLPWTSSPQSSVNDEVTTSRSKRQISEDNSKDEAKRKLSFARPPERLGRAVRIRQPSPELDFNIQDSRPSRKITKTPELPRQRNESALSSKPRTHLPPFRSSEPSPPIQARSRVIEKEERGVSKRRLSSDPDRFAEQARKWRKDPKRTRTIINTVESE